MELSFVFGERFKKHSQEDDARFAQQQFHNFQKILKKFHQESD